MSIFTNKDYFDEMNNTHFVQFINLFNEKAKESAQKGNKVFYTFRYLKRRLKKQKNFQPKN